MSRCTKNYYPDQASARVALAAIREKRAAKPGKVPVRVYPCDVCDGWHVTAKVTMGKRPPWDSDPTWTRPAGSGGLERRGEAKEGSLRSDEASPQLWLEVLKPY